MEEKSRGHDKSSDVVKNLSSEFDQLAEVGPGPATPAGPDPTGIGTGPTLAPPQLVPVSVHVPVAQQALTLTTTSTGLVHASSPSPAPTALVGVHHQPLQGGRMSSSPISSTLLSSVTQPCAGGYVGGGWPEARPTTGYNNMPSTAKSNIGLFYGSTSGIMHHSSLSPRYQSSVGQNDGLFLYQQQVPPAPDPPGGGRPAYCFHCLQFGSVYTINPV